MKAKLKDIAAIQVGYSFRSRLESVGKGNLKVIQMKDLTDNNVVASKTLTSVDMDGMKEHHFIKKSDLVFRSRGLVANSAIILDDLGRAVVAAPLLRIQVLTQENLLPEYLNWYLSQKVAQAYFNAHARGTTQKMISKQTLEECEITYPDIKKQRAIIELASLQEEEQKIMIKLAEKRNQLITEKLISYAQGE